MSGSATRLDRLLPLLSAKERALIVLRKFKAGERQDRALLDTAPEDQASEYNRLNGMINAANGDLANIILVIRERAVQERMRLSWLDWARICGFEMYALRMHFNTCAREPITESEYRTKEQESRREMIPIDDCAMILTEEHHVWDAADYETDEDGDQSPTDEAWYRVRDQKLVELRQAVAAGTLQGKGKGRRLQIAYGSLYDWLGLPVPVRSDYGEEYDVNADERAPQVTKMRRDHEFIQRLLDRGACKLDLPLDLESPLDLSSPKSFDVEVARTIAATIRAGLQENWRELRAVEEQYESFSEAFDGEDVLHPLARERMDDAKAILIDVHERAQRYTSPFELPEPDDDLRAMIQRIVDREVNGTRQ